MVLINCKSCISGKHADCEGQCLCASDNHGVKPPSAFDIINNPKLQLPKNEPMEYEQALRDQRRLAEIQHDDHGINVNPEMINEYVVLLILSKHMVSKFEIIEQVKPWCDRHDMPYSMIDVAMNAAFCNVDMLGHIKAISNSLGKKGIKTLFDTTQLMEASEWIKGKYHIKRIELTGDMLFFNGQCYQNETREIIQRESRKCVVSIKNKHITEIVKYIEDTCPIIKWPDIENSIHLKCLLNGTYDIIKGEFVSNFNPDNIILNQIPHNYDESATWDEISKIVTSIIPEQKARQSFYDFLSSCMHPYTGIDYQFGMVGGTGTGKSQLGVLAEKVLGSENVGDATIHLIAKDSTTQKNMAFKMLNIDYDLNSDSIKQIDVIKKWITQDRFTARGIYEQSSSFRPMSRLLFMANDLYEIANPDDCEAIYDRTYIIRVDKKYRHQATEVKRVMEKTATVSELEGFVSYVLRNATWIYNNEAYHHTISIREVESIWNTYGNRIKMFVDKWIERGVSYRTESSEPFNKWMSYCIQKGFKSKDKKNFAAVFNELIGNTPTKTRIDGNECYAYSGFRIKTDEELSKEETVPFKSSKSSHEIIPLAEFQKIYNNFYKRCIELGASRALGGNLDTM